MPDVSFNPTSEQDIPDILAIYNYYILNSTATFHESILNGTEIRRLLFFDNPRHGSFVIKTAGKIRGYCIISRHHPRSAYDYTGTVSVYLHPEFQRRGIGGRALDFLDEWAKAKNFHTLLAVICAENTGSIKLFESRGYLKCAHLKEVGLKFNRWLDIVYYQKLL